MPDRPAKWMRGARSGIWPGWAESTILQTWPQFSGMRVEIPLVRGGVTDTYTSPGHKQLMMSAWLNIRYLFDLCLWEAGSSSPHADGPSAGGGVRPREEEAATCRVSVTVNGRADTVRVPAATTLRALLRAHLGFTGDRAHGGVCS